MSSNPIMLHHKTPVEQAIVLENISKTYRIYARPQDRLLQSIMPGKRQYFTSFTALQPLSLTIKRGEAVGIIGRNGSGKSTLLQLICGTLTPTTGKGEAWGRISALLELGTGFNPELSGEKNIYLNASILGLSKAEIAEKLDMIQQFADIGDKIYQPVKTYSSGMYVRLAFAVAIATEPDILIVDEALAVGDEMFQRKCFARIQELKQRGTTILFVSHSSRTILDVCDRAILLDKGELLLEGEPKYVLAQYHKMIFAPEHKVEEIRQSLKNNEPVAVPQSTYAEALRPETTVHYATKGAEIQHPHLLTPDGRPANLLERGKEYMLRYNVRFLEPAQGVQFGMLIKTLTGIELAGYSLPPADGETDNVEKDTVIQVSFRFPAHLLPGSYFINVGCSAMINGERTYLHRILDVLMFKILPEGDINQGGIVDLQIKPHLQKIS